VPYLSILWFPFQTKQKLTTSLPFFSRSRAFSLPHWDQEEKRGSSLFSSARSRISTWRWCRDGSATAAAAWWRQQEIPPFCSWRQRQTSSSRDTCFLCLNQGSIYFSIYVQYVRVSTSGLKIRSGYALTLESVITNFPIFFYKMFRLNLVKKILMQEKNKHTYFRIIFFLKLKS
jgi:hypothetical protein